MADETTNIIYSTTGKVLSSSTNWMRKYRVRVYANIAGTSASTVKTESTTNTTIKVSDIIAKAASFIGVREMPAGSNNVQFNTDYYGKPVSGAIKYPWCCVFMWDVFRLAGASNLFYGGSKTAYCPALMSYAKANGQWVTSDYKPGDCAIMNFHKTSLAEHVGIVEKVNFDGSLNTIEGNTSMTSQDNGGNVMRRMRGRSVILGAYRPRYAEETTSSGQQLQQQPLIQSANGDIVLDVSSLRCTFEIKRYAMYYPNQANITIYNLTAGTENVIIQEGYRVQVYAGYGTSDNDSLFGLIFDGVILMCNRWKESGTDYKLQILALDGSQFINEGFCSFTYGKGQTARSVIENIANKASSPVGIGYVSSVFDTIQFSKSLVTHGLAKNTLNDITKIANGTWFVDNGKLYVIAYSDGSDTLPLGKQAVELSETTGLIGNPQQVNQGINARCLLNPKIVPYGLVHIKNALITQQLVDIGDFSEGISTPWLLDPEGIYRVISVKFTGDTRGNQWYTDITAITQAGNVPALLQYTLN